MHQMLDEFNKKLERQAIASVNEIKVNVENIKFAAGKPLKFGKNLETPTTACSTIPIAKKAANNFSEDLKLLASEKEIAFSKEKEQEKTKIKNENIEKNNYYPKY